MNTQSMNGGCGDPSPNHFTGKERDAESGNDFFEARHYGSGLGRFVSPDPSSLSVDFRLPQTWNRYSYVLGNPLSMADKNGLWPWYIHDLIIDEAFPGMSKQDLQILKDASLNMDYGPRQQSAALAFEHGMSNGVTGQTPLEAEQQTDAFIARSEHLAQQIQADWIASGHSGIAPAALMAFGNALHTITDRLSPAHAGYQPWYGRSQWNPTAWWHFARESYITPSGMNRAVLAARQAFQQTFGLEWQLNFMELQQQQQQQPRQQEQVTSRIGYLDSEGNFVCQ
jgi:RHS repeat-associated protein